MCGAPRSRRVGRGADQQLADVGVGLRAALEQVAGDDVGVGAAGHQRARGLAVQPLALGAREVLDDRGGDQAVGEALAVGLEQAGGSSASRAGAELADRDAGDRGDHVRRRAVAERRPAPRRPPRSRGVSSASRRRTTLRAIAVTGGRRDRRLERFRAVRGDLAAELAQQPRVAVDGAVAVAARRAPACRARGGGSAAPRRAASAAAGAARSPTRTPPSRLSRSDGARGSSPRAPTAISSGRSSIRRAR